MNETHHRETSVIRFSYRAVCYFNRAFRSPVIVIRVVLARSKRRTGGYRCAYTRLSDRFPIVPIVRFVDCLISLELQNHPPIANDYLEADVVTALRLNPTCLRHRDYEAIGYAKNLFVREASPIS